MIQWVEWLTRPDPEDEVPRIYRLIAVFTVNRKDDGNPEPSIKSWVHPVGALKDIVKIYMQYKRGISVLYLPLAKC